MSMIVNQPATQRRAGAPPTWVWALMGRAPSAGVGEGEEIVVTRGGRAEGGQGGNHYALASVRIAHAAEDDLATLQRRVTEAYRRIGGALAPLRPHHLVRVWNHVPNILSWMEAHAEQQRIGTRRINRYMAFNAGRYGAYQRWYGPEAFATCVPTASAVGESGDDMFIHALAAEQGGTPIDNPRQIAPYQYSRRYGPIPPCFSRATVLGDEDRTLLLAGGTSSVHGEESVYCGDLEAQARETFINLAALVSTARGEAVENQLKPATAIPLRRYHDLRVYHVHSEDRGVLARMIGDWFGGVENIEFVQADLCRRDLLVEIEGVAGL